MEDIFARTALLLGEEAMQKLKNAKVAVMGLGGVGAAALEILARSGIGHLLLVDFDQVSASNLNRQLIALHSTLGRDKTEVAKERVLDINPQCEVEIFTGWCAAESRRGLLMRIDYVLDAIDSLGPKVGLLEDALNLHRPIISVMGAGGRVDPACIKIGDIAESYNCSLAKRVRKYLHRRGINDGLKCVYSSEPAQKPQNLHPEDIFEWGNKRGRPRVTQSSVSYLPIMMGVTAASCVVRDIAGL